jgi:hypothetical protein
MNSLEATTTEQTATVAEQGAHVAPEKASSKKGATKKTDAATRQKGAKSKGKPNPAGPKEAKPKKVRKAATGTKQAATLRPESKGAKVLDLISRANGASLAELMKATQWQSHSVRGFISGTLGTKMGIQVTSAKREDGERVYSLGK